jgi:hypothetical protein
MVRALLRAVNGLRTQSQNASGMPRRKSRRRSTPAVVAWLFAPWRRGTWRAPSPDAADNGSAHGLATRVYDAQGRLIIDRRASIVHTPEMTTVFVYPIEENA